MGIIYRLAKPEDAADLARIIYGAYKEIRELGLHWPAAQADVPLVLDNIAKNDCYVLELDGRVAGTLTLSKERLTHWPSDLPFVKWFAVDPALQGKGIGTKLIDWVEAAVIRGKLGAEAFTLATAEKHPWLLPMYERYGFERILTFDPGNGDGNMVLLRRYVQSGRTPARDESAAASGNGWESSR